jgi:hypothetical protein
MSEFHTLQEAFDYVRVLQKPIPEPKPLKPWKFKPRTRIDGGDPVRTPVDRVAARVVAPAPWWAMPPSTKQPTPPEKQHTQPKKRMNTTQQPRDKSETEIGTEVVKKSTKMFTSSVLESENLVERAKEATAAIEYLSNHTKKEWLECHDELKAAIADMRSKKFAIENESRQMLAALGDIRQFFLDDRHEEQVKRLSEFVTLCERLKALKESGFLDTVADTMLRLEA